jgi:LPS-assembly protein
MANLKRSFIFTLLVSSALQQPAFASLKISTKEPSDQKAAEKQAKAEKKQDQHESTGISTKKPAAIEADSLHYDEKTSVVTATGHVEVMQDNIMLTADKVTYNQKTNIVEADGNISLTEPDGNVFFAEHMSLKDDMKQGIIDNLSARFSDKSIMAAQKAERINEKVTVMDKVVYSPCTICEGEKTPLWQVKANKATIDESEQTVTYKNAFFEVKGVPLLYTPYFSHPTPGADRKSGFLIPKYTNDHVFGTTIAAPYYFNIAPDKDLILTPIITTNQGPVLAGDFRHLIASGSYELKGSITNPDKVDENGNTLPGHEVRGHVEGKGNFNINDVWDWGFFGKRASDDTYLRRYHFGEEDVLTSSAYTTAISDRNYAKIETITFQGLRETDDPGKTPLILPNATGHYESAAGFNGSRWIGDANVLALSRDEGTSSDRLSLKGGWKLPYVTKSGNVFEFNASVRGDTYYATDVVTDPSNPNTNTTGTASRIIPQAELKWSLPLANEIKSKQVLLEPTANIIVSPYGGNPNDIPNEDSQDVEFSDENLFDSNHFSGYDLVESGPRINYGLRGGVYDYNTGDVGFIFGQSYRTKENNDFSQSSGLNDNFSDYVGRVGYDWQNKFNIAYRFRMDNEEYSINRNSVSTSLNLSPVKFDVDYVSVKDDFSNINGVLTDQSRKSIIAGGTLDITDQWGISANGNRNIEDGQWISTKSSLFYKGDCVKWTLSWFKEYTRDRDIVPNSTISIQFSLKNLGY